MSLIIRGAPTEPAPCRAEQGIFGWVIYETPSGAAHIVPTWDIRGHALCAQCACSPVWDDDGSEAYRHVAFDGRLRYEQGQAKHH